MGRFLSFFKKVLLWLGPVALVLAVAWYFRTQSSFFIVDDLQIEVEFEEDQEALLVSMKSDLEEPLKAIEGRNIWSLSLGALQEQLQAHPWVQDVELIRRFPNKIHFLVRLNSVALLYVDRANRIFPILKTGDQLPEVKANLVPLAPFLRNNKILKDAKALSKVLKLYGEVPSLGIFKKENIESVDYNSVTGLTLNLVKDSVVVHLGELNIQTKVLQVLRVTDYLQSQKQKARVIDASFPKKVLVRPRKRS